MKEQDAAHSFEWITHEKAFKLSCPHIVTSEKLVYNHAVTELKKADAELTRLRSELQQKDEVIKELIPIVQWKLDSTQHYLYDFRVSKEDDPDKYAEVDRLQSLIKKSKAK